MPKMIIKSGVKAVGGLISGKKGGGTQGGPSMVSLSRGTNATSSAPISGSLSKAETVGRFDAIDRVGRYEGINDGLRLADSWASKLSPSFSEED